MQIDQKTVADILHLGGQYFLPLAALLRALYSGMRGKFPQGVVQIMGASLLAGLTAVIGQQDLNIRAVAVQVLGNSVFMAGLLAFIMAYLLRTPNRGWFFDMTVGGIIGLFSWLILVLLLDNAWPWWTFPFAIAVGALGFLVLRIMLRQIARLVHVATFFITIGILLVIGAGGVLLGNTVYQWILTFQASH
jgi:hypothetical protein